jgi:hypothetical protein
VSAAVAQPIAVQLLLLLLLLLLHRFIDGQGHLLKSSHIEGSCQDTQSSSSSSCVSGVSDVSGVPAVTCLTATATAVMMQLLQHCKSPQLCSCSS